MNFANYPNVSFNMPEAPAQSFLQKAAGALKNNWEPWAIGADMAGRNLDPNNAFGGIGTLMGQGSLASKEKKKTEGMNDQLMQLIKALSGPDAPGGTSIGLKRNPKTNQLEMMFKGNLSMDDKLKMSEPTQQVGGEEARNLDKQASLSPADQLTRRLQELNVR
jgi:hypothetical protein